MKLKHWPQFENQLQVHHHHRAMLLRMWDKVSSKSCYWKLLTAFYTRTTLTSCFIVYTYMLFQVFAQVHQWMYSKSHWGCSCTDLCAMPLLKRHFRHSKAVPIIIVNSLSKCCIDWILPTSSFEVLKSMCYYAVRDTAMEENKISS